MIFESEMNIPSIYIIGQNSEVYEYEEKFALA